MQRTIASVSQLAAGSCDAKDNPTLRTAEAKALKVLDRDLSEGDPVSPLFDLTKPHRRWRAIDVCRGMKTVSTLQLHLSTLDEMAVRWAFTREGGIQTELARVTNGTTNDRVEFYKAFGSTWEQVAEQCWNKGDEDVLSYVAEKTGRKLDRLRTPIKWDAPTRDKENDAFKDVKPERPADPPPPAKQQ